MGMGKRLESGEFRGKTRRGEEQTRGKMGTGWGGCRGLGWGSRRKWDGRDGRRNSDAVRGDEEKAATPAVGAAGGEECDHGRVQRRTCRRTGAETGQGRTGQDGL